VPDERIFLVPTGVAPRAAGAESVHSFRLAHGLSASDRIVLFVGRVNREKGVDLLVAAFAAVAAAQPDATLVLVGAVYEGRWLAGLPRSLDPGVALRIVVVGEQPPEVVAAAYASADVFAFPSRTDTQALVLQEAALAGLPAVLVDPVLHRHGPLGTAGVLAAPSAGPFASAITSLLADPDRARRIGAAARDHASAHTPGRYAAAMHEVYRYAATRAGRLNACGRTRR
jgi:1,2-diacylglycerol 3-alpha-glucosyltransferase